MNRLIGSIDEGPKYLVIIGEHVSTWQKTNSLGKHLIHLILASKSYFSFASKKGADFHGSVTFEHNQALFLAKYAFKIFYTNQSTHMVQVSLHSSTGQGLMEIQTSYLR
jgi:hypothetical protein